VFDDFPVFAVWLLAPAVLATLGLFGLGRLLTLPLPSPLPWATAWLGAYLALPLLGLAFSAVGLSLQFGPLLAALGLAALAGWLAAHPARRAELIALRPPRIDLTRDWRTAPAVLAIGLGLGALLIHTWRVPLAGWDNDFRWDYLARLMFETGGLEFYPPRDADSFRLYAWPDGIPPAIAFQNLWLYLAAASTAPGLIFCRVATELALVIALTWRLARREGDSRRAFLALALLAASPIFALSMSMAQETGATTVCLLLLANLLADYRAAPRRSTALWIGLAAAGLAWTRDYALLYAPLALGLLLLARAPRAHLALAALGLLAAAPWYLRNALLTGNPLYPHEFAGLLPAPLHLTETLRIATVYFDPLNRPGLWPVYLATFAVALGMGGLLGLAHATLALRRSPTLPILAACGLVLWWLSVPKTAGGWFYALRVLGPILPLLAVIAVRPPWTGRPFARLALGLLALLAAADASVRAPRFLGAPLAPPFAASSSPHHVPDGLRDPAYLGVLVSAARGEGIVFENPGLFVATRARGGTAVSLYGPEAALITHPEAGMKETIAILRRAGLRFLVFTRFTPYNDFAARAHPGIRAWWDMPPTLDVGAARIYDLAILNGETPAVRLHQPVP
jgi:hypothetical protein